MAKPTVRIPLWASGGATADPGAGKEATGWLVSERPPANWINWVWNALGQWVSWHDQLSAKAVGEVSNTTGSTTGTVHTGSVNIASMTSSNDSTGIFDCSFSEAMPNANYVVICSPISAGNFNFITLSRSVGNFEIRVYDADAGTVVDLSAATIRMGFAVFGGNS